MARAATTMKTSKQIFDYFPGIWKLTRKTSSKLQGWPGHITGECIKADGYAIFVPSDTDKNLLYYAEKVTIYNLPVNNAKSFGGIEGRKRYHYRYDEETNVLSKYFTDGRLFYDVNFKSDGIESLANAIGDPRRNTICGSHLCEKDYYVSDYDFGVGDDGQPVFTLVYSVNGPNKCYDIQTDFEKIDASEANALGIRIENNDIL